MPEPASQPFWDGLADGQVRLPTCTQCDTVFFPPSPICPYCQQSNIEWIDDDGYGKIYAFTHLHRTAPGVNSPVVLGIVSLDAGPRLLTRIDAPFAEITIGTPVKIEPWTYTESVERGRLSATPYFLARPTNVKKSSGK